MNNPDPIDIYSPETDDVYLATIDSQKTATIYSLEGLESSDPYTVFLGGNSGLVHIETKDISKGKLLVFKDSYFNCFLPFIISDYGIIDVIDPRYYSGDLNQLILQNQYNTIMYFYNMNTFTQDSSLSLVLNASRESEGQ